MIDNKETLEILRILENLDDEQLAVDLLNEFNAKTKKLGQLILNQDSSLPHEEWKKLCDQSKIEVDQIIKKIRSL